MPTIEEMAARGDSSYEAYSDEKTISDAAAKIKDLGWALHNNADSRGDTATALTILNNIVEYQRSAVHALQATRMLKNESGNTALFPVCFTIQIRELQI